MSDFTGRSIIITGAAGSIGHATACVLAGRGANLMLVDINRDGLAQRRGVVAAFGTRVETFHGDVSRSEDVRGYVEATTKAFGRIDGLFNNAGMDGKVASIETYEEDEFDRIIAVNLRGIFLGLRHVIPVMLAQGGGAIVNTGSIASERGLGGACAYNATKHGVLGLTRTAAADVAARGVRVNAVMPGVIDTPLLEGMLQTMFNGDVQLGKRTLGKIAPQERIGLPREVGEVVAFLLSGAASFVNGAAWAMDGGALCTIRH
ncbi:MAG TPA: SDR family oxidoreductase [Steroidobacteraceae bacterium]|nr:SDR family oxidoreductase [Steroidobacteraceae bacterium]